MLLEGAQDTRFVAYDDIAKLCGMGSCEDRQITKDGGHVTTKQHGNDVGWTRSAYQPPSTSTSDASDRRFLKRAVWLEKESDSVPRDLAVDAGVRCPECEKWYRVHHEGFTGGLFYRTDIDGMLAWIIHDECSTLEVRYRLLKNEGKLLLGLYAVAWGYTTSEKTPTNVSFDGFASFPLLQDEEAACFAKCLEEGNALKLADYIIGSWCSPENVAVACDELRRALRKPQSRNNAGYGKRLVEALLLVGCSEAADDVARYMSYCLKTFGIEDYYDVQDLVVLAAGFGQFDRRIMHMQPSKWRAKAGPVTEENEEAGWEGLMSVFRSRSIVRCRIENLSSGYFPHGFVVDGLSPVSERRNAGSNWWPVLRKGIEVFKLLTRLLVQEQPKWRVSYCSQKCYESAVERYRSHTNEAFSKRWFVLRTPPSFHCGSCGRPGSFQETTFIYSHGFLEGSGDDFTYVCRRLRCRRAALKMLEQVADVCAVCGGQIREDDGAVVCEAGQW